MAAAGGAPKIELVEITDFPTPPTTMINWRKYIDSTPSDGSDPLDRHSGLKTAGNIGVAAAQEGISIAQSVTNTGLTAASFSSHGVSIALTAGAAVGSATGIGLLVAAGALSIGSAVKSGVSAYKTSEHMEGLAKIYENLASYTRCERIYPEKPYLRKLTPADSKAHDLVGHLVLPYIWQQKRAKLVTKSVGAVVGVGSVLTTAYAIGRKVYKYSQGTLGVSRERAARWMACHFMYCKCALTEAIIAELLGAATIGGFQKSNYDTITELLMTKIKSN
ncbi:MAG TPA: hypothetical protein VMD55_05710 [Terracidiphilus sp.]|nr:hypothetical protein [Terracidiphilus sp.]